MAPLIFREKLFKQTGPLLSKAMKFIPSVILLAVALLLAWPQAREFLAVYACLDSGGSYNYTVGTCDHQASHPYAATDRFWKLWLAAVLVFLAALAPSLVGRWVGGGHGLQPYVQRDDPASGGSTR